MNATVTHNTSRTSTLKSRPGPNKKTGSNGATLVLSVVAKRRSHGSQFTNGDHLHVSSLQVSRQLSLANRREISRLDIAGRATTNRLEFFIIVALPILHIAAICARWSMFHNRGRLVSMYGKKSLRRTW